MIPLKPIDDCVPTPLTLKLSQTEDRCLRNGQRKACRDNQMLPPKARRGVGNAFLLLVPSAQGSLALFMSNIDLRRGTLVPIHPDNANTKDWVILLEASTIVGHTRDKLRVALTTQERKLVKKRKLFRKAEYFLIVDGYDPRIHALYFCPQLYKNEDGTLVPLSGDEIGQLMAQALEGGAIEKPSWYEPSDGAPIEPVIKADFDMEFDSLVVDAPSEKGSKPAILRAVAAAKTDE